MLPVLTKLTCCCSLSYLKHSQTEDAASQISNSQDESMIINQTEYEEDTGESSSH